MVSDPSNRFSGRSRNMDEYGYVLYYVLERTCRLQSVFPFSRGSDGTPF